MSTVDEIDAKEKRRILEKYLTLTTITALDRINEKECLGRILDQLCRFKDGMSDQHDSNCGVLNFFLNALDPPLLNTSEINPQDTTITQYYRFLDQPVERYRIIAMIFQLANEMWIEKKKKLPKSIVFSLFNLKEKENSDSLLLSSIQDWFQSIVLKFDFIFPPVIDPCHYGFNYGKRRDILEHYIRARSELSDSSDSSVDNRSNTSSQINLSISALTPIKPPFPFPTAPALTPQIVKANQGVNDVKKLKCVQIDRSAPLKRNRYSVKGPLASVMQQSQTTKQPESPLMNEVILEKYQQNGKSTAAAKGKRNLKDIQQDNKTLVDDNDENSIIITGSVLFSGDKGEIAEKKIIGMQENLAVAAIESQRNFNDFQKKLHDTEMELKQSLEAVCSSRFQQALMQAEINSLKRRIMERTEETDYLEELLQEKEKQLNDQFQLMKEVKKDADDESNRLRGQVEQLMNSVECYSKLCILEQETNIALELESIKVIEAYNETIDQVTLHFKELFIFEKFSFSFYQQEDVSTDRKANTLFLFITMMMTMLLTAFFGL